MTPERFHALLDACGADLRRWPEAERDAARELLATGPSALRAACAEAALLDRDLDAHRLVAPDAALIERIAGAAPGVAWGAAPIADAAPSAPPAAASGPIAGAVPSAARPVPSWWRRAAGSFWPRAGWALTGLAGAIAGAMAVSVALGDAGPSAATDWQKRATAFTDRGADWSEE
jgi:hypothetical protein